MNGEEIYIKAVRESDIHKKCSLFREAAKQAHIPAVISLAEYGLYVDTDAVSYDEGKRFLARLERMAANIPDAYTYERLGDLYGLDLWGADKFNYWCRSDIYDAKKAIDYYDRSLSLRLSRDVMTKKGEILYREFFKKDAFELWKMAAAGDKKPSKRLLDDIVYYYADNPEIGSKYDTERGRWESFRAELYGATVKDLESLARISLDNYIENYGEGCVDEDELDPLIDTLEQLAEQESAAGYSCYSRLMEKVYLDYDKAAEYKLKEIRTMERNGEDEMFIKLPRGEYEYLTAMAKRRRSE